MCWKTALSLPGDSPVVLSLGCAAEPGVDTAGGEKTGAKNHHSGGCCEDLGLLQCEKAGIWCVGRWEVPGAVGGTGFRWLPEMMPDPSCRGTCRILRRAGPLLPCLSFPLIKGVWKGLAGCWGGGLVLGPRWVPSLPRSD